MTYTNRVSESLEVNCSRGWAGPTAGAGFVVEAQLANMAAVELSRNERKRKQ